jgi:hypothetical protein
MAAYYADVPATPAARTPSSAPVATAARAAGEEWVSPKDEVVLKQMECLMMGNGIAQYLKDTEGAWGKTDGRERATKLKDIVNLMDARGFSLIHFRYMRFLLSNIQGRNGQIDLHKKMATAESAFTRGGASYKIDTRFFENNPVYRQGKAELEAKSRKAFDFRNFDPEEMLTHSLDMAIRVLPADICAQDFKAYFFHKDSMWEKRITPGDRSDVSTKYQPQARTNSRQLLQKITDIIEKISPSMAKDEYGQTVVQTFRMFVPFLERMISSNIYPTVQIMLLFNGLLRVLYERPGRAVWVPGNLRKADVFVTEAIGSTDIWEDLKREDEKLLTETFFVHRWRCLPYDEKDAVVSYKRLDDDSVAPSRYALVDRHIAYRELEIIPAAEFQKEIRRLINNSKDLEKREDEVCKKLFKALTLDAFRLLDNMQRMVDMRLNWAQRVRNGRRESFDDTAVCMSFALLQEFDQCLTRFAANEAAIMAKQDVLDAPAAPGGPPAAAAVSVSVLVTVAAVGVSVVAPGAASHAASPPCAALGEEGDVQLGEQVEGRVSAAASTPLALRH